MPIFAQWTFSVESRNYFSWPFSSVHHTNRERKARRAAQTIFSRESSNLRECSAAAESALALYCVMCWEMKTNEKVFFPELMFHVKLCHVEKCDNILIRAFLTPWNQPVVLVACKVLNDSRWSKLWIKSRETNQLWKLEIKDDSSS